jgi:hypothetical protein
MMAPRTLAASIAFLACIVAVPAAPAEIPCAKDIATLCKDVATGGGRIQACLKANEDKVSPECRAKIDSLASEVKLAAVVCRWDIGRLCSDVTPGRGQLLSCLERHSENLSPECRKQLAEMKK